MRIGLVCPYNLFRGGGVQEIVFALQSELTKRGHKVKIVTPYGRAMLSHQDNPDILFLGTAAQASSFRTTYDISVSVSSEAVDKLLEREQFDIIHFHEPWMPLLSRQILSRSNAINIATFHARLPESMKRTVERVITPYTKSILKYIDAFTAVSDAAAEHIRSVTDEPVKIIPNGIDLTKYEIAKVSPPTGLPKKRQKTILFIGRLETRKGVKYLLQAYAKLSQNNLKLIIGGDGKDRKKLENIARDLKLKNVKFLGYIDESTKQKLLQQADLFCSPALYGESFGIVLLEAMASGLVTVAGDNAGYRSVMRDRGSISLVDPRNTAAFAHRLELMLYDEDLRALWLEWATQYVQQFTYQNIVDAYEKLYKASLRKR